MMNFRDAIPNIGRFGAPFRFRFSVVMCNFDYNTQTHGRTRLIFQCLGNDGAALMVVRMGTLEIVFYLNLLNRQLVWVPLK